MSVPQYSPFQPSLVGPRLKLDRAAQHLRELDPEIRAYVGRGPYVIPDDPELDGEWAVVRFGPIREHPDPRWGVRVGEFFHEGLKATPTRYG